MNDVGLDGAQRAAKLGPTLEGRYDRQSDGPISLVAIDDHSGMQAWLDGDAGSYEEMNVVPRVGEELQPAPRVDAVGIGEIRQRQR